jgi:hypothetical protein
MEISQEWFDYLDQKVLRAGGSVDGKNITAA